MRIAASVALGLTLVFVGSIAYVVLYMNLGIPLYDGCMGGRGFSPGTGTIHFKTFPPQYVCRYRTKNGRVVELSQ